MPSWWELVAMPAWLPGPSLVSRGGWAGGATAGLVAEPFFDVEGALVLAGRLLVIPPPVGEDPGLGDPGGLAGGTCGEPGQGVMDQRGSLVPGPPVVQLFNGPLGDLPGGFGVACLQQVVAGFEQVMHVRGLALSPHPY